MRAKKKIVLNSCLVLTVLLTTVLLFGQVWSKFCGLAAGDKEIFFEKEWDKEIKVNFHQIENASSSVEFIVSEDGDYEILLTYEVIDPGFVTGFSVQDEAGIVYCAVSGFQYRDFKIKCHLPVGSYRLRFDYIADPEIYAEYVERCKLFRSKTELDRFVKQLDFAAFTPDGKWAANHKIIVGPENVPNGNNAQGWVLFPWIAALTLLLMLGLTWLCFREQGKIGENAGICGLKDSVSNVAYRFAFFGLWHQMGTAIISSLLSLFFPAFYQNNKMILVCVLTIGIFYLTGFPVMLGLFKNIPKVVIEKKKLKASEFVLYVVISVGVIGIGSMIGTLVHRFLLTALGIEDPLIVDQLLMSSAPRWLVILTVGILAPVFEELIFRKILIDHLINQGEYVCILVSGLLFGFAHGNFSQFFYAAGLGMVLALLYIRTGKIGYAIRIHMIINLATSVVTTGVLRQVEMRTLPNGDELSSDVALLCLTLWFLFLAGMAIAGVALLIAKRKTLRPVMIPGKASQKQIKREMIGNKGLWIIYILYTGVFLLEYLNRV